MSHLPVLKGLRMTVAYYTDTNVNIDKNFATLDY